MEIKETANKRRSRRAFFTLDDNIGLYLTVKPEYEELDEFEASEIASGTLLSISTGGVSITGSRYKIPFLKEGDRLILTSIQTPPPLGTINRLDVEIKYIVTDDFSVRIVLGCEFMEISSALSTRIEEFVSLRMKQNNI